MQCRATDCSAPAEILEPLPLCMVDGLRVTIASAQYRLADAPSQERAFQAASIAAAGWLLDHPDLTVEDIAHRLSTDTEYAQRVLDAARLR